MLPAEPARWSPLAPSTFVDRRTRITRDGLEVRQNVRAWHGLISRRGADGRQEFDRCPHAHLKAAAARRCAEAAAARVNRAIARGEDWALTKVGTIG